jgi:hypothetical protein
MDGKNLISLYNFLKNKGSMVHPQDREVDDWDTVIEGVGRLATA